MNKNGKVVPFKDEQKDFVGAGFKRLDKRLVDNKPPNIKWGQLYKDWPIEQRLEYAEKVAASMNNAAFLIQTERDKLMELLVNKEAEVISVRKAIDANNSMINAQITSMNEEKQLYNKAAAEMKARIKELEK